MTTPTTIIDKEENKPIKLLVVTNPNEAKQIKEVLFSSKSYPFQIQHEIYLKNALDLLDKELLDEILLDLFLPDSEGINTFFKVYSKAKKIPIVTFSSINNENLGSTLIENGAQDYLTKEQIRKGLLPNALYNVLLRYNRLVKNNNSFKPQKTNNGKKCSLTTKELQILKLVAEGKTNKEIAAELCLSTSTVRNHIAHIFSKLGVVNRVQATTFLLKEGGGLSV